jgi:hypothetical protein
MPIEAYEATDVFRCTSGQNEGGSHKWQYLGQDAKAYQCVECAARISKSDLKDGTDA